jgi:hypothetical protein
VARHAEHLVLLSRRLAEAGSASEALPPGREAVGWFQRLYDADPGAHRAGLASALTNLGNRLAEHGEPAEALAVTGDAVALRRELAASGGGREQADYAAALHNLAGRLLDNGQPDQAAAPAREAVAVFGRLAGEPGADQAYRARQAVALTNLAQVLAVSARPSEAVAPAAEAVEILRALAAAQPESYLPALAAALIGLSQHLAPPAGRGRHTRSTRRAVHLAAEAVGIYQRLAGASPAAYQPDLAAALTNLGLRHAAAGEAGQAVAATEQALAIRRRLAQAEPARHRRELAAALTNLGLQLAAARRRAGRRPGGGHALPDRPRRPPPAPTWPPRWATSATGSRPPAGSPRPSPPPARPWTSTGGCHVRGDRGRKGRLQREFRRLPLRRGRLHLEAPRSCGRC